MDSIYTQLNVIFHETFGDDTIVVTPELKASDVLEWDSLNHIRLILAIQKSFKIKFSAADTSNMKNVGDLAELIRKKTA